MPHPHDHHHTCLEETTTSHPHDPIPKDPAASNTAGSDSKPASVWPVRSPDTLLDADGTVSESEPDSPLTPPTSSGSSSDQAVKGRRRRASTVLLSTAAEQAQAVDGSRGARVEEIERVCCGGGCCLAIQPSTDNLAPAASAVNEPQNEAYKSLRLKVHNLGLETRLTNVVDLPPQTVFLKPFKLKDSKDALNHPPTFVKPHPPYDIFPAKIHSARELTNAGALKRTFHFDLDVSEYPAEGGDVDFVVGGAIGVQAPNEDSLVEEILTLLHVPRFARDVRVLLKTSGGRWPTIWGDDEPRELETTRRELLKWCSDIQSYPPTKALLRLLAEYATQQDERKILLYLSSAQGQAAFCDLRTGPYITVAQLLSAFPSSQPPLDHLLSILSTLMPRFYSLSHDPSTSCKTEGQAGRRIIEIAVTVHELPNWRGGSRTGLGSGFFQRIARQVQAAEAQGRRASELNLRVPMFRGLMANPLAREFATDGPMILIGAGVGIAPFRGFVQRRLQSANCANKVWVIQGIRDSLLDELYTGEWGVKDAEVRKVVQSRAGEGRYVQEEVRHQADLVWFVVNALDGRIFVCGSSKGMGAGVESALVDVVMDKGNLRREEALEFWRKKQDGGQYIVETW